MTNTITNDTTLEPRSAEVPSEPCAEEAEWIRREHEILTYDAAAFIERAAALGETLVKTKEKVKAALGGHGAWGPWVARNLPNISDRTVRRYMEIFRRKSEPLALEDPGAFLAEVHGHRELPPPDAAPASKTDAASDLPPPSDGAEPPPPPPKRTSKRRKVRPLLPRPTPHLQPRPPRSGSRTGFVRDAPRSRRRGAGAGRRRMEAGESRPSKGSGAR
jgi:hypothetical protein